MKWKLAGGPARPRSPPPSPEPAAHTCRGRLDRAARAPDASKQRTPEPGERRLGRRRLPGRHENRAEDSAAPPRESPPAHHQRARRSLWRRRTNAICGRCRRDRWWRRNHRVRPRVHRCIAAGGQIDPQVRVVRFLGVVLGQPPAHFAGRDADDRDRWRCRKWARVRRRERRACAPSAAQVSRLSECSTTRSRNRRQRLLDRKNGLSTRRFSWALDLSRRERRCWRAVGCGGQTPRCCAAPVGSWVYPRAERITGLTADRIRYRKEL